MADVAVPRGATITLTRVDGTLTVERDAVLRADGPTGLEVTGRALFRGDARVDGAFACAGLTVEKGSLRCAGALTVRGDIDARRASLDVAGPITAGDVDVGRELSVRAGGSLARVEVGGAITGGGELRFERMGVGGAVEFRGRLVGDAIRVGGRLRGDQVALRELQVGGAVEVGDGEIREAIRVGGSFASRGPVRFGELSVGGQAVLGPGSQGGRITIGGRLEGLGALTFGSIEIGGLGRLAGEGTGERVEVGGQFSTGGPLALSGRLEVGGRVAVGGRLTAAQVEVGGALEAEVAVVEARVEVGGTITSRAGVKAADLEIGRRGRAVGPLVGGRIVLDKRAEADALYGTEVRLRAGARAASIVADRVVLESGVQVGAVTYRTSLTAPADVVFGSPPRRVDPLPPFPL